ncbi:U3 small nucleolar RNA-associated protein 3 [Trypanosoma theileri]|uniref:U3 small nucleolar RNA-associated protein 3 n=1 Tax=Trypanosoma theileri TaxID=67003 RepID=A0A1X0NYI2_9TRYP|nr:U3 small nucleolar RNA-associated protein 3 [Trypanosoma theileri]ORC89737.1 U3 small nucleolar RNA-associated protein 3 [Trypanosoma theileri]
MAKKGSLKKRSKKEEQRDEIVEDLDLEVDDYVVEDEDVIHNRRTSRKKDDDEELEDVLPSEAHKMEGYDDDDDERGAHLEEEALAVEANKNMRRKMIESDFDVGGIITGIKRKRSNETNGSNNVAPVIEAVERDYAALSSSERMAIVQKESPEMIKMLEEMKQYLAEVKELAKPLQELLFQRRLSDADRNLVQFLETKVQLMLSYCMHVTFYLLLKTEGKKVAGHPVIDNLVEIRVYLEKLFPLEEKLQYSLNRLLSGKTTSAAHLDTLRPLQHNERGSLAANSEGKKSRKQLEAIKKADEIEKEEFSTMNRIRTKKSDNPDDVSAVDRKAAVSALGYHEDEDQYFAKLTADDEGEEQGLSLVERLRRRQRLLANGATANTAGKDDDSAEEEEDDNDNDVMINDDEEDEDGSLLSEDDVDDYDALVAEEHEREAHRSAEASQPKPRLDEPEVGRRKTNKKIETHRGLTKTRPKDRKTPRTAQRRKYEKGMRIHKAQSRTAQPEPEGGFIGVPSIKSRVTQSIRF